MHLLARSAERAEQNGFLDALVTSSEDRSDQNHESGDDSEERHEPDDESDFVENRVDRVEHEGQVDHRNIWMGTDDRSLHGRRLFARSNARSDDVEARSIFQNAARKNNEEIWLDPFPVDLANADNAIGHEHALHVEDEFIAKIDFEIFSDALLDGDGDEVRIRDFYGPGAFDELFTG